MILICGISFICRVVIALDFLVFLMPVISVTKTKAHWQSIHCSTYKSADNQRIIASCISDKLTFNTKYVSYNWQKHQKSIKCQLCLYNNLNIWTIRQDTIEREFGAYDSIRDNYPKYVLSLDDFDMSRDGIKHRNIQDFLLADQWDWEQNKT